MLEYLIGLMLSGLSIQSISMLPTVFAQDTVQSSSEVQLTSFSSVSSASGGIQSQIIPPNSQLSSEILEKEYTSRLSAKNKADADYAVKRELLLSQLTQIKEMNQLSKKAIDELLVRLYAENTAFVAQITARKTLSDFERRDGLIGLQYTLSSFTDVAKASKIDAIQALINRVVAKRIETLTEQHVRATEIVGKNLMHVAERASGKNTKEFTNAATSALQTILNAKADLSELSGRYYVVYTISDNSAKKDMQDVWKKALIDMNSPWSTLKIGYNQMSDMIQLRATLLGEFIPEPIRRSYE